MSRVYVLLVYVCASSGEGGVKRNKSSACYNILTLDYEKSPQGQALQYKVG